MVEAWKGGRSVPESSAVDAAVVQRAPVEHQTDLHFHAAACVEMELTNALVHVTVDDNGSSGRRQPTGSMRNSAAHRTSWFAVDGSAARRRQSRHNRDLTEIVIKRQILPT